MPSNPEYVRIDSTLDADTARLLGAAIDMTYSCLKHNPPPTPWRETIVRNILNAVKDGERNPVRLCNAGLAALAERDAEASDHGLASAITQIIETSAL
jgi:hypothetical protein